MDMLLRDAQRLDFSQLVPPTAIAARIRVTVTPPSGTVLIYTPGKSDQPVTFNGPVTEAEIPLAGPFVDVQLVAGAKSFMIDGLGWTDGSPAGG
jgi:hypothetical protein